MVHAASLPPTLLRFVARDQADAQLAQLPLGNRRWRVAHHIRTASGLGERNYFANRILAGQNHHQPV